ncbi:hypothetical protein ACFO0A_10570 [Novosphingobium tardum]|jgi:hypothetical protein|uniref:DUF378 domain-containing protein n=1 Tax=Novosphingobium tardum TaxID=1538021 RepID=A0ABV8RT30_9SPHN
MRLVLQIFGVLLIISGLFWALQGAGIIMWPASSFMLAQGQWVLYGLITAAIGAVLLWLGRRRTV